MLIKELITILLVLNVSCSQGEIADVHTAQTISSRLSQTECITSSFHYVVVDDWIKSSNFREIKIFMDPKSFSLENLKYLFSQMSAKFPEPQNLTIRVKTDWSQLALPTDCEAGGMSGSDEISENYDFHRAEYYRRGSNVYFYYSKELKTEKMLKVVLSGKHQPKQRWESE